ncbi:hypothetical protein BD626DRAFT_37203 [Schizophyllum amplum]|uniref:Uncharacterized protein n=1 Tax=Schizophyllum amplum TaxID=97359 RepID=A0A550CEY1_9AGAR|nr:hypothetical protein BD626DRAFT_37203 [Auriculariopsis ampla]
MSYVASHPRAILSVVVPPSLRPRPAPISRRHNPNPSLELNPTRTSKNDLRARIHENLREMAENARKEREKAISEDAEHEDDHQSVYEETMRDLRIVAEESYQAELQREREARRWSSGSSAPPAWLLSEQQAIWDKAIQGSGVPQTPLDAADPAHSDEQPPGDSSPVATRPPSVRSRTISQAVAPDAADDGSPRSRSERRPSLTASSAPKLVPEIWRPSITPDEGCACLTPGLHAAQGQHRQRALRQLYQLNLAEATHYALNSRKRRRGYQRGRSARETDHVGGLTEDPPGAY